MIKKSIWGLCGENNQILFLGVKNLSDIPNESKNHRKFLIGNAFVVLNSLYNGNLSFY